MGLLFTIHFYYKGRRFFILSRGNKVKKNSEINIKKVAIIGLATVVTVIAGYNVYNHLPFVKVSKAIAAGNKYSASSDYEAAIDSYNTAIEIDDGAVEAYNNMAGAYLSIDDYESAKQVLYDGWQNTENTDLLKNYLTVIMNDAVTAINKGEGNIDTVLSVIPVLEADNTNSEAINLLDAAYTICTPRNYPLLKQLPLKYTT